MKKMIILFLQIIILMNLLIGQSSSNDTVVLKIGTMDLPPYGWIDSEGHKQGLIYDLNQEIGIRSGFSFTNTILPFNRMLLMLKKGELDLISSQAHDMAPEAGDKLTIQFTIDVIAGTKKGSDIRIIEDFRDKILIYHQSASYPQLEGLPKEIYRVDCYEQALKTLYLRLGVDGAVFSEPAYYYWLKDACLNADDFGEIIVIEKDKEQWIFVRRDLPVNIRETIMSIVQEIYLEKLYENLLIKYGKE